MTDRQAAEARDEQVAANTDREIWRKGDGDGNGMSYYEPSIHVTERGEIGINVGGTVFVRPVEEWHALSAWRNAPSDTAAQLTAEEWEHAWRVTASRLLDVEARLAQAEQERDEAQGTAEVLSGHLAATAEKLHVAEVRLREYEEALTKIEASAAPRSWETPSHPMNEWTKREPILRITRAVLAASGGREAP